MDLIVRDTLCRPGETATLHVRLERGWFCRAVAGRPVTVTRVGGPSASSAPATELITDRGGRAAFVFAPPASGTYVFTFTAAGGNGQTQAAALGVAACREAGRPAVAVDIDGTLTNRANSLRTGAAGAQLRDEFTVAAAARIAERFDWVYVSGRRRRLAGATRQWCSRMGLPTGAMLLHLLPFPVPGFISARWKARLLAGLRQAQAGMTVGVGNTRGDAGAYAAAGMLPLIFTNRSVNGVPVGSWRQVEELLLGDRLPLTVASRVILRGGGDELTISPRGAECAVALRGPAGVWEPPAGPWPVLREELLRRLAANVMP